MGLSEDLSVLESRSSLPLIAGSVTSRARRRTGAGRPRSRSWPCPRCR